MRDIITDSVTKHVGQSTRDGDVTGRSTDYGDELAFVVEARGFLRHEGDRDGRRRSSQGGGGFVEEDWVFGFGHFGLKTFIRCVSDGRAMGDGKEGTSLA